MLQVVYSTRRNMKCKPCHIGCLPDIMPTVQQAPAWIISHMTYVAHPVMQHHSHGALCHLMQLQQQARENGPHLSSCRVCSAALSYSSSLMTLPPAHLQYAWASARLTHTASCCTELSGTVLPGLCTYACPPTCSPAVYFLANPIDDPDY